MTYKTTIFFNYCFDKRRFQSFLHWFFRKNYPGQSQLLRFLEKLKFLGFHSATQAGFSISIEDLKIPYSKSVVLSNAENSVLEAEFQILAGNLTQIERYQRIIEIWNRTSENLKFQVLQTFQFSNLFNPVYLMAFSGARGNISQIRQLVGMRGLMANPLGQIIDFPIRSNFREGLTLTEYLISCSGARKGIVDTALRTAASGYLTRRLVDVAHHVIISQIDCQQYKSNYYSTNSINETHVFGIVLEDLYDRQKKILSLHQRLIGRVLAENILLPETPVIIGEKDKEISLSKSQEICNYRKKVLVRSPLTCQSSKFICQLCYGWNLAEGQLVSIGEAVGVLAAQAIGEPGTQLTMRTFHTGGVFTGILMDQIYAPFSGIIKYPSSYYGILIRTQQGKIAYLSKKKGRLFIVPELKTISMKLRQKFLSKITVKKKFNVPCLFDKTFKLEKKIRVFNSIHKKKLSKKYNFNQSELSFKIKNISRQIHFGFITNKSTIIFKNNLSKNQQNFYNNKILLCKLEKLISKLQTIRSFNKTWLNCIHQKQNNLNNYISNIYISNFLTHILKSYKSTNRSLMSLSRNSLAFKSSTKYCLEFHNSTLLYTRQGEKIVQKQLIAEIPYIDNEQSVENEQEILSSISGEIYFENFIFIEKTFHDFKTISKISEKFVQTMGEFWILFGQSFKNFLISKRLTLNFLRKMDLVDDVTPFTQICLESTNLLTETQFAKLDNFFLKQEQIQLFFLNFPKKQKHISTFKLENIQTNFYLQKHTQKIQINFLFFKKIGYLQLSKMNIQTLPSQTGITFIESNKIKKQNRTFIKNTTNLLNIKTWIIGLQGHSKYVYTYNKHFHMNLNLLIQKVTVQLKKPNLNIPKYFIHRIASVKTLKLKSNFFLSDSLLPSNNANKFFCDILSDIKQYRNLVIYDNFKLSIPIGYFFQENLCIVSINRQGKVGSLGQTLMKNNVLVDNIKNALISSKKEKHLSNKLSSISLNIQIHLLRSTNPIQILKKYPRFLIRKLEVFKKLSKLQYTRFKYSNLQKNQSIVVAFKKRCWYSKNNFRQNFENIHLQNTISISQKWLYFKLTKISSARILPIFKKSHIHFLSDTKVRSLFFHFFVKNCLFLHSFPKKWLRQKIHYKCKIIHWQNLSNYKYLLLILFLQKLTFKQIINNDYVYENVNVLNFKYLKQDINWIELEQFYNKKENPFFKTYYLWRIKNRQNKLKSKQLKIGLYVFVRIFFYWNFFQNSKKYKDISKNLYNFLIPNNFLQKKATIQKKDLLYLCSIKPIKFNLFFINLIQKFYKKESLSYLNFLILQKQPKFIFKNIGFLKNITNKKIQAKKNNLFSIFFINNFLKIHLLFIKQQSAEKQYQVPQKRLESQNITTIQNHIQITKRFYKNSSLDFIKSQKQSYILKHKNNNKKYFNTIHNTSLLYTKSKNNLQNIHWNYPSNGLSLILHSFYKTQSLDFHKWKFFGDCLIMLEKKQYPTYFKNFIQTQKNFYEEQCLFDKTYKLTKKKHSLNGPLSSINTNRFKNSYTYYPNMGSILDKMYEIKPFSINIKPKNFNTNNKPNSIFFLDKLLPSSVDLSNIKKSKISSHKIQNAILDFYWTSYILILKNFSFIKNFKRRFFQMDPQKPIFNTLESPLTKKEWLEKLSRASLKNKKNLQNILLSKTLKLKITSTNKFQLFNVQNFLKIYPNSNFYIEYISKKSFLLDSINMDEFIPIKNSGYRQKYSTRYFKSQIIKKKYSLFQNNPILFSMNALIQKVHGTKITKIKFNWILLFFYPTNKISNLCCYKLVFGKKNLDNFFYMEFKYFFKKVKNRKFFRSPSILLSQENSNSFNYWINKNNKKDYKINFNNFFLYDKIKYLIFNRPITSNYKKLKFKIFRILKIMILEYFYYYNYKNNFKIASNFYSEAQTKVIKPINKIQSNNSPINNPFTQKKAIELLFNNSFEIPVLNKKIHLFLLNILPLTQIDEMKLKNPEFTKSQKQSSKFWRIYENTQCLNIQLHQSKILKLLSSQYKQYTISNLKFQIVKKSYYQAVETQFFIRFFLPFLNNEIVDCIDPNLTIQTRNEIEKTLFFSLLLTNFSDFFAYAHNFYSFQKTFKYDKNKKPFLLKKKFLPSKNIEKKSNSLLFFSFSITQKNSFHWIQKKKISNSPKAFYWIQKKQNYQSLKYHLKTLKVCLAQNNFNFKNVFANENNSFRYLISAFILQKAQVVGFKNTQMQLGSLIRGGEEIFFNTVILNPGQLVAKTKQKLLFRRTTPYLLNKPSVLHIKHGELISKNQRLYSVFYNPSKTGDIVQGIPKIEEIFEARKRSKYRLNELYVFSKDFLFFEKKISAYLKNLQKSVVNNIQRIYCGQGVYISDKHIEIIVRQMTSNVLIIEPGQTGLLCGEVVALQWIYKINTTLLSNPIIYEPLLMGMTKTCLETSSFLSAASFQETTYILGRAALQNQIDFIRGLKQNVILGNLIPIGTGCF